MNFFIRNSILLILTFLGGVQKSFSQCTNVDFTVNANYCLEELVRIENVVTGVGDYEWDLCANSIIEGTPSSNEVNYSRAGSAYDFDIITSGNDYHVFIPDRNQEELLRLDFNDSLLLNPATVNLGNFSSSLSDPTSISILQNGSDYSGLLVSYSSNLLQLLHFSESITASPTISDLSAFVTLNGPAKVELFEHGGSFYAFVLELNIDQIKLISFGSTIDAAFSTSDISILNSNVVTDFDLIRTCDDIAIAVSSRNNNTVNLLNFSSGLDNPPVQSVVSSTVPRPVGIDIVELEGFHILVSSFDGSSDVFRITLDDSFGLISQQNLGNINGVTRDIAMEIVYDEGDWLVLHINSNGRLYRYKFPDICNLANNFYSSIDLPDYSYNMADEAKILLRSITSEGLISTTVESIIISNDTAPAVDISTINQCISSLNTFTPTTGLTSYSWDFDNDGVEDSNFENPNYQFLSTGTHTIRLDVSDGTCNNFIEQQITIYPEPPTPTFDVTGPSFCENIVFDFANTIDETGYDDVLSYEWSINGVVVSSQRDTTYVFETPGEKIIGLKAAIPGCESTEVTQTINIIPTPQANFTADTVCVNELVLLENLSVNAISYSWDFGDGTNASDFEPSKNYLDSGNYVIALDAIDSSGDCIDTELKTIRVNRTPPGPIFELGTSTFCVGLNLNLANLTADEAFNDEVTYQWNITDLGMVSGKDVDLTFITTGEKTITLQSFYRTCESSVVQQTITISDLPVADFSASPICSGETLSFVNQSTDAVSYNWDFDNGFTSTDANPQQLFSTPGLYNVSLTVFNQFGCEHTVAHEVVVSSVPDVSFNFDVPCTSTDGIQFTDLSTVAGADIVLRTWFVEDVLLSEAQNLQNPVLTFGTEGTINVRLVTVSSNGCEASYNEDIQILSTPQPDFSITIGCDGEATSFNDITSSPGNTVGAWLWTLDGVNYNTQDISHTFSGVGTFDVTLEVTGQNFCSETITQQVTILELPTVDFSIDGDCSNEVITLTDASTTSQDPIVSREWRLDDSFEGNGNSLILESLPEGTYDLMLEVTTESGCVTSTMQQLVINQAPQSDFASSRTFGVPEDQLIFTNQSTGASNYQWLLDGELLTTNPDQQQVTFTEPGTYQLSLVAENSLGCSDISTTEILIATPVVDLSIGQFEVVGNQGTGTIFLEIENNSNLPIEVTEAVIELQNQFSVTEQIETLIGIGETQLVSLNIGIPLSSTELSYLCVTLNSQYSNYPDLSPINNEKCITIAPRVSVEAPFPNPATNHTRVKLVAPESGVVTLSLFNSAGKVEFTVEESATIGLNNYFINLRDLNAGMYFIEVNYAGTRSVQRIIKR